MSDARPLLSHLPHWISHWLGYRTSPPPKRSFLVICIWAFLGSFSGLCILLALFTYSSYFVDRGVPSLIASYGASAVLCYHAIEAPLAQPRALVGGHFLSALTGVCVIKLFALIPSEARFESVRWVAAALSTAIAIVVMAVTETTHPPAGATALLPAIDEQIFQLGWYFLPVVLLSSALVLVSACLVNNLQRRYPVYWFTPAVPSVLKPAVMKKENEKEEESEKEKRREEMASDVGSEAKSEETAADVDVEAGR